MAVKKKKRCIPFTLKVMVFSPEAGYKYEVEVDRDCNPEKWSLHFDLSKKQGDGTFVDLVSVDFTATTGEETQALQQMVTDGVTPAQADALQNDVYPKAKALEGDPSDPDKVAAVDSALAGVAASAS